MIIRQVSGFKKGYNEITASGSISPGMLMDFGILKLGEGGSFRDDSRCEKAYLLLAGEIRLQWGKDSRLIRRDSCFDENPWCLHVCENTRVDIEAFDESEIAIIRTENETIFEPKLYEPAECHVEERGRGTMKETSTRLVKTIFDNSNAHYSNLVLGEVIGFPGKWSSYPPHHHPQPEIYFFKFLPENGFGFSELGEDAYKTKHNDAILITEGLTHSQAASPGHAIYYLWVIRHLKENRYVSPVFVDEYKWLMNENAVIWPDKKS